MRLPRIAVAIFLFAGLWSAGQAHAQYKAGKIVYKGAEPYTEQDLDSVAGLRPGQFLERMSLANAAQHLLDTGLFNDAQVSLAGTGMTRDVVFILKTKTPAELLPASFENLVWFTPEELARGLRERLPLYRGYASDAGNFGDSILAALQQMLAQKNITASLSQTIVEPTTQHPVLALNFRAERPSVRVGTVNLQITGASAALAPLLSPVLTRATGSAYNEGLVGRTTEDLLLAPARNAGYIEAQLQDVQRTFTTASNRVLVTLNAKLVSGGSYTVSALNWQATTVYSAADFDRNAKLHPGDLARASALLDTEVPILSAYRALGDIDVYIAQTVTPDEANHTVAYTLRAVPGEPYHLGTLTAIGLSANARQVFDNDFTMKVGDLYSEPYVNAFLKSHIAQPVFQPYTIAFQAVGDPQTHLVDLTLTFVSK